MHTNKNKNVFVGMSGGVDSTAAALILKEEGYNVFGLTMLLCQDSSEDDDFVKDAKSVAKDLKIPLYTADFRSDFHKNVIDPFAWEYSSGRTPNPCVLCNPAIKFGKMLDFAKEHGADFLATGHYAINKYNKETGLFELHKSPSPKDQSYFLCRLTQNHLKHTLFPLGLMDKNDLREKLKTYGISLASKPDSQEICFIPNNDYADYLSSKLNIEAKEGDFLDTTGNVLGRHKGIIHYTVGQRKGLGMAFGQPMYVKEINPNDNSIVLCTSEERFGSALRAIRPNWVAGSPPSENFLAHVKIRSTSKPARAEVKLVGEELFIRFDQAQTGISPGQSAVIYDGDKLLGGAFII